MQFALFVGLAGTTWDAVQSLTRHAESTGWDAVCLTDHFMPNTPDRVGDSLECLSALAALAASVPRIRLGSIVLGNTYRHPAVLAKTLTNIDIISGGRLIAGIGGAWQQNEHEAYGIPFYTVGERLARLDEACQVLKALWTQDRATFKGRYCQLSDAPASPEPVQRPYPELLIGGGGEKVTLKIAAKHADHWNTWGGPRILKAKNAILDAHCATVGRGHEANGVRRGESTGHDPRRQRRPGARPSRGATRRRRRSPVRAEHVPAARPAPAARHVHVGGRCPLPIEPSEGGFAPLPTT
jgi:alkanesulfonate monooxygenase SsuD/methylene tetrahydromethanopterin reductase-like flavin-dependent oxidoreductase (luciferase family)